MATSQPGILALGASSHHHLELALSDSPVEAMARLGELEEAVTSIGGASLVVGLGPRFSNLLEMPEDVADFEDIAGVEGFTIPGAQRDLWLWIQSGEAGAALDLARVAERTMRPVARLALERQGFSYRANRDLLGFEDGTENPPPSEAAGLIRIPDGARGAGGSVALVQHWVHDVEAFETLETPEREAVFGRRLADSAELAERAIDAHVSRVVILQDGQELEIWRRSTPFGNVGEHGLVFIAFSPDRARLARMLARMAGAEDGVRDHLTRYSTPVGSSWYFVPPLEALIG